MVFLGLRYPTPASRRAATDHGTARGFNYPDEHVGASRRTPPSPSLTKDRKGTKQKQGDSGGFTLSRPVPYATDTTFLQVGAGGGDFAVAKRLVTEWKHFQLGWSEVAPSTAIEKNGPVCVCANVLGVWIRNPLQVVYVEESTDPRPYSEFKKVKKRFSFAHGCLRGHLLAGEEAFVVELRLDDSVWFGVHAFSKPAHALAFVGYPAVRLLQWRFARDAMKTMQREVRKAKKR